MACPPTRIEDSTIIDVPKDTYKTGFPSTSRLSPHLPFPLPSLTIPSMPYKSNLTACDYDRIVVVDLNTDEEDDWVGITAYTDVPEADSATVCDTATDRGWMDIGLVSEFVNQLNPHAALESFYQADYDFAVPTRISPSATMPQRHMLQVLEEEDGIASPMTRRRSAGLGIGQRIGYGYGTRGTTSPTAPLLSARKWVSTAQDGFGYVNTDGGQVSYQQPAGFSTAPRMLMPTYAR